MKIIEQLLHPTARFRINNRRYKISEDRIRKNDRVLDLRDNSHGRCEHSARIGYISVRTGPSVELIGKKYLRKLILSKD